MLRGAAWPALFDFVAKCIKKLFWEIVDVPWWFLNESRRVLISFALFFERFKGFRWFLWCRGTPSGSGPAGVRFPYVLRGF